MDILCHFMDILGHRHAASSPSEVNHVQRSMCIDVNMVYMVEVYCHDLRNLCSSPDPAYDMDINGTRATLQTLELSFC